MKGAHENGDACDDESPGGPKVLRSLEPHRRKFVPSALNKKTARRRSLVFAIWVFQADGDARDHALRSARKIPILSRLRRFDRIALAGKSLGGLEGLFPGHPPRDRAPAGIVVEGELPDDQPVF